MASGPELLIWTVYDHPLDYPDYYVARAHAIYPGGTEPTDQAVFADDLDALRALLDEQGLYRLDRNEDDDPKIIESWI